MSPPKKIEYQGNSYDHTCLTIRLGGQELFGVKSLSWGPGSVEGRKVGYGTSVQPLFRSRGQYKPPDVSLEMYAAEWKALVERRGDGFLDVAEDLVVEGTGPDGAFVDTIVALTLDKPEKSSQEGGDLHVVKVSGTCMVALENGKLPMKGMTR